MSGVLSRLVGRATGAATAGLRPRLPALFETGMGDGGFLETASESPAVAAAAAPVEPVAASPRHHPSPQPEPEARPTKPAPLLSPTPPILQADAPVSPPVASIAPAGEPALRPVLREAETRTAEPVATPIPTASEPLRPAPPPLLPVQPPERLEQVITTRMAGALPTVARPLAAPTNTPTEPEITIQIGRLDIRAETPAPQPLRRASPASSLPSLADYLRGGRR